MKSVQYRVNNLSIQKRASRLKRLSSGMGKYIPVQTNCEITGEVLIEISDITIPGLALPEIVYDVKKKLAVSLWRISTLSLCC